MNEDVQSNESKKSATATPRSKRTSKKRSITTRSKIKRRITAESNQPEKNKASAQPDLSNAPASPGVNMIGAGKTVSYLALFVAIVALGIAGYFVYQTEVATSLKGMEQTATVKLLDQRVSSLQDSKDTLSAKQQGLEERLQNAAQQSGEVAVKVKQLSAALEKLYGKLDRSRQDWTLEEIEQLLLLANQRLHLAGDVAIAMTALEMSDQRLRDLGDPGLVEVRRNIAIELTQLKNTENIDVSGLALRLNSLALNLDGLKIQDKQFADSTKVNDKQNGETVGDEPSGWSRLLDELWQDISGLVRIQNVEKSYRPLLTPEQRYFLQENLSLMLSGAQLALLRFEQSVYRQNLNSAISWVKKYYNVDDPVVKKLIGELEELADKTIKVNLPDISASLSALRSIKSARAAKL